MTKLIDKLGLKAEQIEEIEKALSAVNGRATTWTATAEDVVEMLKAAEAQLSKAGLPLSQRVGARAEAYSSYAPGSKSYRNSVTGNIVRLRRFSKEWRVVSIDQQSLWPQDNRAGRVKIFLSADQIEKIRQVATASFNLIAA